MSDSYRIGIDLGGTTVTAGLVDEENKILHKLTWATALPRPAEDLEQHMAKLCRAVAQQAGVDFAKVASIGIGTPGSVNSKTGKVGFNANFGYHNWDLGSDMEKLLGCRVYVENDANAAAYGEYLEGSAKGYNSAVCVTLGTGIGGGIILDGRIFSGANGAGGEIGHTVTVQNGRPCMCGRRGCWEKYGSARALSEDSAAAAQEHPESLLHTLIEKNGGKPNAKMAFDAMAQNDAVAKQVVENWLNAVGCGLVNVINTFQPDVVCIGGGVSAQGEVLLQPLQKIVDAEDYNRSGSQRTQIKLATLRNDAAVVGGANLYRQH